MSRRTPVVAVAALIGLAAAPIADAAKAEAIYPLDSVDGLTGFETTPELVDHQGRTAIKAVVDPDHKNIDEGGCDNCTIILVDDTEFQNGTIEIDLAGDRSPGAEPENRGFVGIVFRAAADGGAYEGVYFRPHNSVETNNVRRNFSVQYFSHPDYPWHHLRKETPGMYESWAPIAPGEWTSVRLEVEGETAKVYVDDIAIPVLVVNDLKMGADASGQVGLFTEPNNDAYFSNLRITPL